LERDAINQQRRNRDAAAVGAACAWHGEALGVSRGAE
jgi:hypothetical protein